MRLAVHDYGDRTHPAMVLLHALGETSASWDGVLARFTERHRVLTVDLRGHGASEWPGRYSFELMRDDVLAVLDDLELSDIVLIGHSMGGTVAYLIAQAQPDRVARLVIEDVPPPWPRDRPLPERPDGDLDFDWAVVAPIAAEINDPTRRWWTHLSAITAPTLLVGGGPTSHVPQELLVEVADLIPDCALVTIDAGHNVHETQPDAFADAVLGWLTPGSVPVR